MELLLRHQLHNNITSTDFYIDNSVLKRIPLPIMTLDQLTELINSSPESHATRIF